MGLCGCFLVCSGHFIVHHGDMLSIPKSINIGRVDLHILAWRQCAISVHNLWADAVIMMVLVIPPDTLSRPIWVWRHCTIAVHILRANAEIWNAFLCMKLYVYFRWAGMYKSKFQVARKINLLKWKVNDMVDSVDITSISTRCFCEQGLRSRITCGIIHKEAGLVL